MDFNKILQGIMKDKAALALGATLLTGISSVLWTNKDRIIEVLKPHVPDVDPMELGMKLFSMYKSLNK